MPKELDAFIDDQNTTDIDQNHKLDSIWTFLHANVTVWYSLKCIKKLNESSILVAKFEYLLDLRQKIDTVKTNIILVWQFGNITRLSNRDQYTEAKLIGLGNQLKPANSSLFGTRSIALWDMAGKYPRKKVQVFYLPSFANYNLLP